MFATVSHNVTIASLLPLAASMGCRITSKPFRKGTRPVISLTRSEPAPVHHFDVSGSGEFPASSAPDDYDQGREYEQGERLSALSVTPDAA